jgi:hypothetical protein
MKMRPRNVVLCTVGTFLAVALPFLMAACSKASSSTTPLTTTATATSVPTTSSTASLQRQGTNGTIVSINGNTLTLSTPQGQVTVNVSSSTPIEETVQGAVSDLSQGKFVAVTGNASSSGNIAATSITVIQQAQSGQFNPSIGATSGNRGNFTIPTTNPNGSSTNGATGRQVTTGTISQINGNNLTVTTAQSQVTVNIGSDTAIQKTTGVALSDLHAGDSLTVFGSPDNNGNINAISITVRPQGQGSSATLSTSSQGQTSGNATSQAIATTYHIGVFSDAGCTNPVTNIDWGSLSQGASATQTIYIENMDNQTTTVAASVSSEVKAAGVTFTNSGPVRMIPGSKGPSVYQLQMSLSASNTATLGDLSFSISFTGAVPVSITSHVSIVNVASSSSATTQTPSTSYSTLLFSSQSISEGPSTYTSVYTFTPISSGPIYISGTSSSTTGYILIVNNSTGDSNTYAFGTINIIAVPLTAGYNYSISFGNQDPSGTITANLTGTYPQ